MSSTAATAAALSLKSISTVTFPDATVAKGEHIHYPGRGAGGCLGHLKHLELVVYISSCVRPTTL